MADKQGMRARSIRGVSVLDDGDRQKPSSPSRTLELVEAESLRLCTTIDRRIDVFPSYFRFDSHFRANQALSFLPTNRPTRFTVTATPHFESVEIAFQEKLADSDTESRDESISLYGPFVWVFKRSCCALVSR